ncbi:MAG: SDR family oxidoreductase [Acidimicrobiia bacterium]|nr:SDR family oxidoreductase [Acidimicrobiia bacterium]
MRLNGKVVVITGGSGGIGLAIADAYQREGASVVLFARDPESLSAANRRLGNRALTVQGDVTDGDDLARLFATTAERFPSVDVLVANAGGINFTPLGQTTEADFDTASDLNFKAVFFTVQAAVPSLADGASVIVTGNALASTPVVGPSVAIAAKAAVRSLAQTFAVELASRGIRVNVLSPGPTATAAPAPGETSDAMTTQITRQIPLGRWGTPEDVAKAAVFLASDDSSYITGADLPVGGGIGMGWVPPTTN